MLICPKCGYRDNPLWRHSRFDFNADYMRFDEVNCSCCDSPLCGYKRESMVMRICWNCGHYESDSQAYREVPCLFENIVREKPSYFINKYLIRKVPDGFLQRRKTDEDFTEPWRDEVEKWKLEHERLYYCIPKWKLDEFIRYVDDPPQWNWSEYNRRKRELYASTEEKKKSLLGSEEPNK